MNVLSFQEVDKITKEYFLDKMRRDLDRTVHSKPFENKEAALFYRRKFLKILKNGVESSVLSKGRMNGSHKR